MYGLVVVICCGITETHSGAERLLDSCHRRRGLWRSKHKGGGFAEAAIVPVWEVVTSLVEMSRRRLEIFAL